MSHQLFVIWTNPLFRDSVRLLLSHPSVKWVGAASNWATAQPEILSLRPDTILVEEGEDCVSIEVTEILKATPWNVRVVTVSLDNDKLIIFHREQKTVGQAEDLLHLILGELS
jgi:DNA-binding NarL/FixJ family response regulator